MLIELKMHKSLYRYENLTVASFELVNYIECNLLYVGFDYLNGTIEVKPISYCSFNFVFLLIIIWHTCGEDGYW